MSSTYRTLSFVSKALQGGGPGVEVISDGTDVCYQINGYSDAVHVYHKGPGASRRPIVIFENVGNSSARQVETFTFHKEVGKLAGSLLTSHSQTRKVFYNGTAGYEWVFATDGLRLRFWYEIQNPIDKSLPFARLRVENGVMTLEVMSDIWLRSQMLDGIIAAIVLMCLNRDAWVANASPFSVTGSVFSYNT